MNRLRSLITIAAIALTSSGSFGYEEHSFSQAPTAFLMDRTSSEGVYLSFDTPEKRKTLVNHCEKQQALFAHGDEREYKCVILQSELHGADYLSVKITGPTLNPDEVSLKLYSLRPFEKRKWKARAATKSEFSSLAKSIVKEATRYEPRLSKNALRKAKIVFRNGEGPVLALVSDKPIKTDEYDNERVRIFFVNGGAFDYVGTVTGTALEFVDLNEDGIPEIMMGSSCDGTCIEVLDVKTMQLMMTFSGH